MKTWFKRLTIAFVALLALLLLIFAAAWWRTEQTLAQRWQLPAVDIALSSDPEVIARGEYLARTRHCTGCHGATLGGTRVVDIGPVMQVYAPNLTAGGVLPKLDAAAFEHALRHAVGRDGQPLVIMPAREFMLLSNQDVGALYAYLRSLPAQPDTQPKTRIGPLGRVLHLFGMLPLVDAPRVDHARASRGDPAPSIDDLVAYGAYVAQVCTGCHGARLAGGRMAGQPPDVPPPANLTAHASGLGSWSEADFLTAMRTGKRPDGSGLNDFMPWRAMGQMSDTELHALWVYLRSLPPQASPRSRS